MSRHIYIVAAEKSGDELGAALAGALLAVAPATKISAIGGAALQAVGYESAVDTSPLAILGFLEGVKSYPIILDRVEQTCDEILRSGADMAVLIDSWGFMIRVAKGLKKRNFAGKIVKYVAPQVWAMREGRSKILARHIDHLLSIHAFDAPYFTRHGLPVSYVGNPVFDTAYSGGDAQALKAEYGINPDALVLCILFGSRLSEIQTLAKPFARAVSILRKNNPNLVMVSPVAGTIAVDVAAAAGEHAALRDVILLGEERKLDCFAAADMALACSGTVSTQLACVGIPSIIAYRLNPLTFMVAKHLFKPDYVSIVNIAADAPLMPEFIQHDCTGEKLSGAVQAYIDSKQARAAAKTALLGAVSDMRRGANTGQDKGEPTAKRAANALLSLD